MGVPHLLQILIYLWAAPTEHAMDSRADGRWVALSTASPRPARRPSQLWAFRCNRSRMQA
jgi:hypothetical protein